MQEALKIIPETSSSEKESSKNQILAKKLKELTDDNLDTLYNVVVNAIKKNRATLDNAQITKKQGENLYSLDRHKKEKETSELEESLTVIIQEMNQRDY